jgi:phage-related protein
MEPNEKTVGEELVAEIVAENNEKSKARMREFLNSEMKEVKELERCKTKLDKALKKANDKVTKITNMTFDEFDDYIRELSEDDDEPVLRTRRIFKRKL